MMTGRSRIQESGTVEVKTQCFKERSGQFVKVAASGLVWKTKIIQ